MFRWIFVIWPNILKSISDSIECWSPSSFWCLWHNDCHLAPCCDTMTVTLPCCDTVTFKLLSLLFQAQPAVCVFSISETQIIDMLIYIMCHANHIQPHLSSRPSVGCPCWCPVSVRVNHLTVIQISIVLLHCHRLQLHQHLNGVINLDSEWNRVM